MISYPLADISQALPSPAQPVAFASVVQPSSFTLLQTNRHAIYNKSKDTIKKHKKSFRTAKFLFPIQMNMATRFQYQPIMPQIPSSKFGNRGYNPTSHNILHQSSDALKSFKYINSIDQEDSHENITNEISKEQSIISHNDYNTFEKENEHVHNSQIKSDNSLRNPNINEQISIHSIDSNFDIDLQSSPNLNEFCKTDVSNICFDIVKRGNFPSILVKNGCVEIV